MTPSTLASQSKLVVVGAGYAGVLAANRLARKTQEPVLLVSQSQSLLNRVRLHETAARGDVHLLPLTELLHPRVELVHASASGLEPAAHLLHVQDGSGSRTLHYRKLVLALGSHLRASVQTGAPHAHALASHESALAFHEALRQAPDGVSVHVIGGGLTAIELAAEIAEAQPRLRVRMLCSTLSPDLPHGARASLRRALARLRVEVLEGITVRAIEPTRVVADDGQAWDSHLTTLATGFAPSVPAWLGALPTHADGRLAVDHALRVLGHADILAVGDVAAPPASCIGTGLATTRMGCVDAMPMAAHAADVIAQGEALPFHFNYPGRNVSLGRRAALVLLTDRDDRPTGRFLDGRLAALIKELVCRLVVTALRLEAREWLGYAWLGMHTRTPAPALPATR